MEELVGTGGRSWNQHTVRLRWVLADVAMVGHRMTFFLPGSANSTSASGEAMRLSPRTVRNGENSHGVLLPQIVAVAVGGFPISLLLATTDLGLQFWPPGSATPDTEPRHCTGQHSAACPAAQDGGIRMAGSADRPSQLPNGEDRMKRPDLVESSITCELNSSPTH